MKPALQEGQSLCSKRFEAGSRQKETVKVKVYHREEPH